MLVLIAFVQWTVLHVCVCIRRGGWDSSVFDGTRRFLLRLNDSVRAFPTRLRNQKSVDRYYKRFIFFAY